LVGGGGSILAVPLLVYVVGIASPYAAIGTVAVAVTVNPMVSLVGHARGGGDTACCSLLSSDPGRGNRVQRGINYCRSAAEHEGQTTAFDRTDTRQRRCSQG
jgi:hypothetical protein